MAIAGRGSPSSPKSLRKLVKCKMEDDNDGEDMTIPIGMSPVTRPGAKSSALAVAARASSISPPSWRSPPLMACPLHRRLRMRLAAVVLAFTAALMGCDSEPDSTEVCAGFGDWQSSPYVLPYAVGASYFLDQGNCSPPGNG